jgi:hypothetical protein
VTNIITFTDTIGIPDIYYPVPASKVIPDWYKNLESYIGGDKRTNGIAGTSATAKRCMPIFDAITGGYIISTHTDIWVSQKLNEDGKILPFYEWKSFNAIEFHSKDQLPEHPDGAGHELSYPKWINAWSIKTPPGYSCLFISPLHRETPIITLPGIVDTDKYTSPVNFPFVLRDPNMDGLIPAGTPIVQVIPFKRDSWEMKLGTEEDYVEQALATNKLRVLFFDSYKRQYRQPKDYR